MSVVIKILELERIFSPIIANKLNFCTIEDNLPRGHDYGEDFY